MAGTRSPRLDDPALDDLEWDSPHCCSCCCACCACHKISQAFWWVLLLTIIVLGVGVGVLVDGFIKQADCASDDDFSTAQRQKLYDDCRQRAFIQLIIAAALGVLFILLLFVTCCAFMDVLCFRRFRSRPHMRPKPRVRTPRQQARYDAVTTTQQANGQYALEAVSAQPWQPAPYQMQQLQPAPVIQQPNAPAVFQPHNLPIVQAPAAAHPPPPAPSSSRPASGTLPVAPVVALPHPAGAAPLSAMPTLGERMRHATPTQPARGLGDRGAGGAPGAATVAAAPAPVPPPVPSRRPSLVAFAPAAATAASASAASSSATSAHAPPHRQDEWGADDHYGPGSTAPSAPLHDPHAHHAAQQVVVPPPGGAQYTY